MKEGEVIGTVDWQGGVTIFPRAEVLEEIERQKKEQFNSVKEDEDMNVKKELKGKERVMYHLSEAQKHLQSAYTAGTEASALAAEIPAFQTIQQMGKDVTPLLQSVAKMRGL